MFGLTRKGPLIVVRAETAKNKREEPVYLMPEIAGALKDILPGALVAVGFGVSRQGIRAPSRLKVDPERVGVAYRDEQGRYADFHALRYTCATFMRKHGISDNFARKQMRHQTLHQTDGYTDGSQFEIYEAVKGLPPMLGYTQGHAQILGGNGQNGSQPVATIEGTKPAQVLVNEGVWRGLSQPDAGGQMERAKGFEPSTLTLAT